MKVITIKVSSIIREFVIWIVALAVAFYTNVYAIREFDAPWSELWSQLHVVVILSFVYFILFALIRLVVYAVILIVQKGIKPLVMKSRTN